MHHLAGGSSANTPLDPDETAGLIPTWVATRGDLDRAEQDNIVRGQAWATSRQPRSTQVLDEGFLRLLHRRMFGDVWRWAGSYRRTEKNIGVEHWRIVEEVARLLGDTVFWIEQETYDSDETAVRFHHRLVAIHPFPNGNGRLARLAADLLVESLGRERFGWGIGVAAHDPAAARAQYIDALRAADRGEIEPLLRFARA